MKCKGQDCKCQAESGEFCSDDCKQATEHGHCHCGHDACK